VKVLIVGAAGDVGKVASEELGKRHEIITAGRTSGDITVDLSDESSIIAMYNKLGTLDAVVSTAGDATFCKLGDYTKENFMYGLQQKVMGQVSLVLTGLNRVKDHTSFTLTSGILDRDPIKLGTNAATANAALTGFVRSAAIEMPRGLRINVISPGLLDVSVHKYGKWFHGHTPVSAERVGLAFAKSVEGANTGQTIYVD